MSAHNQPGRYALIERYWNDAEYRAAHDAERARQRQATDHALFAAHDARVRAEQERRWAREVQ